jgi:hypothetical protein
MTFQNNCPRKLHTDCLSAELPHIGGNLYFPSFIHNGEMKKPFGLELEGSGFEFQLEKFLVSLGF